MNSLAQTEKELEHEKKRLKEAGLEVMEWLQTNQPLKLASENPWVLAGIAVGVGFFVGQWIGKRQTFLD